MSNDVVSDCVCVCVCVTAVAWTRFAVNSSTGELYTVGQLDRETEASYTVQLTASDLDPDLSQRRTKSVQATISGQSLYPTCLC